MSDANRAGRLRPTRPDLDASRSFVENSIDIGDGDPAFVEGEGSCTLHEEIGFEAIKTVIADRPQDYLRAVVSILPKELEIAAKGVKSMSDNEIDDALALLDKLQAGRGDGATPAANPAGRPKGSRNRLGEAFVADMCLAWEKNGIEAIERVVAERPADFLKLVAGILPKEIDNKDTTLDDMSHDEVIETLAVVRRLIAEGAEAPPTPEGKPAAGKDD